MMLGNGLLSGSVHYIQYLYTTNQVAAFAGYDGSYIPLGRDVFHTYTACNITYNRPNSLLRTSAIEVHGITRPTPQRHMEDHSRQHGLVPYCTIAACPPLQKTCSTCTHRATSSAASPNCLASQAANWTTRGRSPACGQRPPEQKRINTCAHKLKK